MVSLTIKSLSNQHLCDFIFRTEVGQCLKHVPACIDRKPGYFMETMETIVLVTKDT